MGVAGPPVVVSNHDAAEVTTEIGPFMSSALAVAGFAIIDAPTLAEAIDVTSRTTRAVAHGHARFQSAKAPLAANDAGCSAAAEPTARGVTASPEVSAPGRQASPCILAMSTAQFYDGLAATYHALYPDWYAEVAAQGAALHQVISHEDFASLEIADVACGIGALEGRREARSGPGRGQPGEAVLTPRRPGTAWAPDAYLSTRSSSGCSCRSRCRRCRAF